MNGLEELVGNHPKFLDFLTLPIVILLIVIFTVGILGLFSQTDKHSGDATPGEQKVYAIIIMIFLVGQIGNSIGLSVKKGNETDFYESLETATLDYVEDNFDAHKATVQESYYDGENYLVEVGLDNINHKTVVSMKYSHDNGMLVPYGKIDYETLPVKEGSPLESLIADNDHLSINSIDEMKEVSNELRTTGTFGIIMAYLGVLLLAVSYMSFCAKAYDDSLFFVIGFVVIAFVFYIVSYLWHSIPPSESDLNTESFTAYHIEQNYDINVPIENMEVRGSFGDYVKVYTEDTDLEEYATDVLSFELDEDSNIFMINHDETDLENPLPVKQDSALERLLKTS